MKAVDQILVTVHHDGRYSTEEKKIFLAGELGRRAWSIDGVSFSDSISLGTTGETFVTIPMDRYRELTVAETKLQALKEGSQ